MKIGVPQGLLYSKYHVFIQSFLEELGAEIIVSPNTNKKILDEGVRCCVDEACLPMKVFHGHVSWLKDRCDAVLIPRLMGVREKEYICPMFCGLIEMVSNNIPQLPDLIDTPIYSTDNGKLSQWAKEIGGMVTGDKSRIMPAFGKALQRYADSQKGFNDEGYPFKIGLIGHTYNIYDRFINMDLKKKLNGLGIGVITSEQIDRAYIDAEVGKLFKKPFWTFAQEYYGAAVSIYRTGLADGIIYLSSFSCGIDSVVTELIQCETGDFPFMILKLDEHTGEAGFDTRIEAFSDMLKRRCGIGHNLS
jgi:predicted nucleotide-binding protein (sugar kinase/HSP70/actin superfamily)